MRSISRIADVSINTVTKLLVDAGKACNEYHNEHVKDVTVKRVQADEIWSFCYSKEKNVPEEKKGQFGYGDVWTFTAIDADSKLMITWHVGSRDLENATMFMHDVAWRLANRVQLTTDGHKMYLEAVESAFGSEIDFAQLVKIYRSMPGNVKRGIVLLNMLGQKRRRSPATLTGRKSLLPMLNGKILICAWGCAGLPV